MANIVLPDGSTVGEFMAPQIEVAYETAEMPTAFPRAHRRPRGPMTTSAEHDWRAPLVGFACGPRHHGRRCHPLREYEGTCTEPGCNGTEAKILYPA